MEKKNKKEESQAGTHLPLTSQMKEGSDEYAENPEEILSEEDLKELRKFEEESSKGKIEEELSKKIDVIESWDPKTKLGGEVKDRKIKNIDEILDNERKILEPEIVDSLINLKSDLILIGQAKGKFGGGKRRAWKQTQRKTEEGNVLKFSAMAVVGDENGHVGIGEGNSVETLPARDKAIRKAKIEIFKIKRGCSAFDCACSEMHTVPFEVEGKSGSVRVRLIPAPQGTGLATANELKKILKLAGIKDVYSITFGKTRTTLNLAKACIDALKKTTRLETKKRT